MEAAQRQLESSCLSEYTIGALIIRIGLWGPLYCTHNGGTPKIVLAII